MTIEFEQKASTPRTRKVAFLSLNDSSTKLFSVNSETPSMDAIRFSYGCAWAALELLDELPLNQSGIPEHKQWAINCLLELTTACLASAMPSESSSGS
jgi:hypothetical protein